MKVLGNRLLVERVEEEKKDGFQTVDVQDTFVNKGRIVQIGDGFEYMPNAQWVGTGIAVVAPPFQIGDVVLFNKYSPDTQEVEHDKQKMKIIVQDDVIAVL